MNLEETRFLAPADFEGMLSPYLTGGRKQESWRIDSVEVGRQGLRAKVSMVSVYVSGTDDHGFHLTIFSTLEFLSQLMIIYGHVWAGVAEKTREAWMVECHSRSVSAIRESQGIDVEMTVKSMRRLRDNYHCAADFRVTDRQGGLFEVTLKGFV